MSASLSKLKDRRKQILEIATVHGISDIKIFGSVARLEECENSDIDLIVSFEEGRSLFDLIRFKDEMSQLLDRPIDVVTKQSIHATIRDDILHEAIEL